MKFSIEEIVLGSFFETTKVFEKIDEMDDAEK